MRDAFGESSESEEDEAIGDELGHSIWEPIVEIGGLWLCRDFLSPQQQSSLLSSLRQGMLTIPGFGFAEGWFGEASSNNQCLMLLVSRKAMRFGDLPPWAIELSDSVREVVVLGEEVTGEGPFSTHILWREPLFDQLIANVYQPGEGICAHVDLMRFEDGIAIVSLESSCVMHFSRVEEICDEKEKVAVYLSPGSLVLLSGDARYLWKHEINRKPGFQVWQGRELDQLQRTSITLRRLCPS
ncbi:Uncharacterized protein P8A3.02c [Linum perenne]